MASNTAHDTPFGFEPDIPYQSSGNKDSFAGWIKRIVTSATLLVIAFILMFLLHQYLTGLLCIAFGFNPKISYNDIGNLPYEYRFWTLWRVTVVYTSGPLLCLILGIFLLDFFNSLSGKGTLWRCFILWCMICSFNLFLAHMLISPIAVENYTSDLYSGFSIVGAWWRLGKSIMIPMSFVALTISLLVGYLAGGLFIKFSFSKTLIDSIWGRRKILLQLYILPVLVAVPVLLSLTTDTSLLIHVFHLVNLLLMSIGMFMGVENISKETRVYGKDVLNTLPVFWFAFAGALIALILFFLR